MLLWPVIVGGTSARTGVRIGRLRLRWSRGVRIGYQTAQRIGIGVFIRIVFRVVVATLHGLDLLHRRRARAAYIRVHTRIEECRHHLIARLGEVVRWLVVACHEERDTYLIAARHRLNLLHRHRVRASERLLASVYERCHHLIARLGNGGGWLTISSCGGVRH